jgi:hypothetical protein
MGGGTFFRLAGEMQTTMEKLRAKTQYQSAIRHLGFPGVAAPKILNRF